MVIYIVVKKHYKSEELVSKIDEFKFVRSLRET